MEPPPGSRRKHVPLRSRNDLMERPLLARSGHSCAASPGLPHLRASARLAGESLNLLPVARVAKHEVVPPTRAAPRWTAHGSLPARSALAAGRCFEPLGIARA